MAEETRLLGKPRTEEERRKRHTERYGEEAPLPPRGKGLRVEESSKILLAVLLQEFGSPGIVVDESIALNTSCKCYKVNTTELCWSRGVIGTLSSPQREAYCPTKIYLKEGISKRIEKFKEAATVCKEEIKAISKGERLEPWLKCMGREAGKRGVKL